MARKISPAKELLRKVREEQKEYSVLVTKREQLLLSFYPQAIRYDKDHVQTTPEDVLPDRIADLCKLDDIIVAHIAEMDSRRVRAMSLVNKLEKSNHRLILTLYYFSVTDEGGLLRWEDVADVAGYTVDAVKWTHGQALQELNKVLTKTDK